MAKLLIVENQSNIRQGLTRSLGESGHEVFAVKGSGEALDLLSGGVPFDLVLSDRQVAESNDLELLNAIKEKCSDAVVVLINASGKIENEVSTIKADTQDYLMESSSINQIQHVVERELELMELRSQNEVLLKAVVGVPLIESRSRSFRALIERARQTASSDATVLLTGETGVGKNVLARLIHDWGPRRNRPFITIKCATLSEDSFEPESRGRAEGLLKRSAQDSAGPLDMTTGGTILLDEVADLSFSLQTRILHFLEDRSFEHAGDDSTVQADARVIAASNRSLTAKVSAGEFRSDLYYRLNVVSLNVPPLREHLEDLVPLAERLLAEAVRRNKRSGLEFSEEAKKALSGYSWPGNIRELRNVIERAVVLSRGNLINTEDLPDAVFGSLGTEQGYLPLHATLDQLEEEHIRRVLARTGSREDAAAALGIGVATLWRKRKRYHIE